MTSTSVTAGNPVSSATVGSGSALYIESGGSAFATLVSGGGTVFVTSGGAAFATLVSSGGAVDVLSSGATSGDTIYASGTETVSSGGVAFSAAVSSGGSLIALSSGVTSGAILYAGGSETVSSGGSAYNTVASSGGIILVASSGLTSGTLLYGGGSETISSGGLAVSTTISGAFTKIHGTVTNVVLAAETISGGVASGTIVNSFGYEYIFGGVASNTTVSGYGRQIIDSGVAVGTVVSHLGQQTLSGGVASGTTIYSQGEQILVGGSAVGTVVSSIGDQTVLGGTIEVTRVLAGGRQFINFAGKSLNTTVANGGSVTVAGGSIIDTMMSGLEIFSGGSSYSTTVGKGGIEHIAGGVVSATFVDKGGSEYAYGGTISGTEVGSGGEQEVYSGAVVTGTVVEKGGIQDINAGTATGTSVGSGGEQFIYGGAMASGTTDDGLTIVESGGRAYQTTVGPTGQLVVLSAGYASGVMISGGTVSAYSGSILDGGVRFAPGAGGTLSIANPATFYATVSGFQRGDTIDLTGLKFSGNAFGTLNGSVLSVTEGAGTATIQLDGTNFTGETFQLAADSSGNTGVIVACFRRGTRISTARGAIAVEDLRVGDRAITASGAQEPIVWIGHRALDCRFYADPAVVWPVRVAAGAFAEGKPARELWLSPGHNVAWDGALMPIASLCNGVSIAQVPMARVEYWHVELARHDVILAEGLEAESYLDTGNRTAFANAGAFIESHPDFAPRHWAETCLPLVLAGEPIARAKAALLARLGALGHRLTREADAHLLADGRRIDPIALGPRRLAFTLPEGCARITLRSRVFVPAEALPAATDRRALGLCVGRMEIDGEPMPLDGASMPGWHAFESQAGQRWTDGAAPLPAGARLVVIDLAGPGHYWADRAQQDMALLN